MFDASQFRELISGRRRGAAAALARFGLRLAEWPYTRAVTWRNRRYDARSDRARRVAVPVVSVGNLTLGGTGKTPMVEWLARWFRRQGVRVTIISRGYGAEAGGRNDEAIELEQKLPDVPHLQHPDRVAAAETAIEEFDCQLILLDDGFQHRRLARDLDLVMLDALEPFGFDHVFPRGMLREPVASLRRADVVVLSRADLVGPDRRAAVRRRVEAASPGCVWAEAAQAPASLIDWRGREKPLDGLAGRKVAAFCGLGNPAGFRRTLDRCGCRVAGFREFPDHHAYRRDDVASLGRWATDLGVDLLLCTHKDLVKLQCDEIGDCPLRALRIGLEFSAGLEALEARLRPLVTAACQKGAARPEA